ncbi:hypothetical protein [Streptomyces sp. NPDC001292]|uniref:hypothetical protein n=1 Tax=Streptomyces sp. NPDC001292 TaxID=3364558 RepID=UPI00367BA65E
MGERGVFQVGEDLLDLGVFAVHGFGLGQVERAVGEDDVVAPDAEQFGLPLGCLNLNSPTSLDAMKGRGLRPS